SLETGSKTALDPNPAFSPDGKYIAVTLDNRDTELWNTATGALQCTIEGHRPELDRFKYLRAAFEFLRNGTVASISPDGTIRLFDQVTGMLYRIINPPAQDFSRYQASHESMVRSLVPYPKSMSTILPNGDLIVLLPGGYVWVWSWETETWSQTRQTGNDIVQIFGCMSDGRLVVGICPNELGTTALCLLDSDLNAVRSSKVELPPSWKSAVALSRDTIAWGTSDGTIEFYRADTGESGRLKGHARSIVRGLTFSADGIFLVSVCDDQIVRSWHLSTGATSLIGMPLDMPFWGLTSAVLSPDTKLLAAVPRGGSTIQLYEFPGEAMPKIQEARSRHVRSIQFSPDGQQLAAILDSDHSIRLYATGNGALQKTLRGHSASILAIAFSQDSQRLASASRDNLIRLWCPKRQIAGKIINGQHLGLGNFQGEILILDVESGRLLRIFDLGARVIAITFSSEGRRILCVAESRQDADHRSLAIWDTSSGQLLHEYRSSTDNQTQAALSPDGNHVSYSVGGKDVVIYDVDSEEERHLADSSTVPPTTLAFSGDGKSLATCRSNGEIKLWDVTSAELFGVATCKAVVRRLSFSTTGDFLETDLGHIPFRLLEADPFLDIPTPLTCWWYQQSGSWIMEGPRKMLWIPPTYSRHWQHIAHHDGSFALVYMSGIRFMKFNQDEEVAGLQE
ncbi:MAG: hypothetical protein Q9169_008219, partial [Polycauliona sp. 2 TL-2023]